MPNPLPISVPYTFIYSTRNIETELRVESVLHIGEVLVAQELEQHTGNFGNAGFVIA